MFILFLCIDIAGVATISYNIGAFNTQKDIAAIDWGG